jgi:peptidoglycan biosynthesis protein MviN/MurJ (putative lipid II flippase)
MTTETDQTAQVDAAHEARKAKRRRRRRVAKVLLYVSLIVTAVMILAEPWLLLPIGTAAVALSMWD